MNRGEGIRIPDAWRRVVVEGVTPEVDCGRTAIKRVCGDDVVVQADVFADGHDLVAAELRYRAPGEADWRATPMRSIGNDRFQGAFVVTAPGRHLYQVAGWVDEFGTWREAYQKRRAAGQGTAVDLAEGAALIAAGSRRAAGRERRALRDWAAAIAGGGPEAEATALSPHVAEAMAACPDRTGEGRYPVELAVEVERERAQTGAWYEVFPRSWAVPPERHGTLRSLAAQLPYIAGMGFDVLYLTPIHPIGRAARRGRNNSPAAQPDDVGSPWAIGASEGGHRAIHPDLGNLDDFRHLVGRAAELGLEVAMDLALQCSPEHPYVREHPEWFRHRPDGSIRCAENPPKRYDDIFPLDFACEDWRSLWAELLDVVRFWMSEGIRIFRVDNPHTKPFPFWEWLIGECKAEHHDAIFLAEAFTRPKVMHRLAKAGFSQSYTYFAWRNGSRELAEYMADLRRVGEYFRPNFWPNTPDILTEYLQTGGRPAFAARLVLAATLSGSYGIYGPAFELCDGRPLEPGREDYLDSEKYEVRRWPLDGQGLQPLITRINRIRREHACLRGNAGLTFHPTGNDRLIAYTRQTPDQAEILLVVVNCNPFAREQGWVEVDFGGGEPYQVHDLLSDARYIWQGQGGYVALDPQAAPAHIFRVRRRLRRENGFDYYT